VDADKLANQYIQDNQHKEYKLVNMLPTNGAQLHLETGTMTYQMKKQVMEARNLRNQVSYLCKKYDWEPTTFEMIAWEPHRRAINRHTKQKVTMVKYLNGITPVGKVISRYDKKYSAQCPSCEEPVETQDHLHQCPHQARQQWRDHFIEAMKQTMGKYKTPLNME
jgi:hypothetical protein